MKLNTLIEKIKNEIATIDENELIVLNYSDGKYYIYSNEYLKNTCLEFVEGYPTDEREQDRADFVQAILECDFWQFVVTRVLQHREKDCHYMVDASQQCDEVALSCN